MSVPTSALLLVTAILVLVALLMFPDVSARLKLPFCEFSLRATKTRSNRSRSRSRQQQQE